MMSMNINGLVTGGTDEKIHSLAQLIHYSDIDVMCVQEVNNIMGRNTRRILQKALQRWQTDSVVEVSTSEDRPRRSNYQPGGTMLIMRGKQCRLGKSMSDECMGRWSHTCMRIKSVAGSGNRSLHFISLYRATKTMNGPAAEYVRQQRIMLRQERVETPEDDLKIDIGTLL